MASRNLKFLKSVVWSVVIVFSYDMISFKYDYRLCYFLTSHCCLDHLRGGICTASRNQTVFGPLGCCCKILFCFIVPFLPFILFSYQEQIDFLLRFTKQVGGVHSHLISRVQRDKSRVGCFMSQNEIMMTVFPMFQQHIEPHLVHAHVSTLETHLLISLCTVFIPTFCDCTYSHTIWSICMISASILTIS